MGVISSDFAIDGTNLRIYHASGTSTYPVNTLYSWLESTFAGADYMQYEPPMSASTPTQYNLINGWFLPESSLQYLYTGGISTTGYTDAIYLVQFGATYTNAVSGDIGRTVTDGTHTATLLDYDNTNKRWWVRAISGVLGSTSALTITSGTSHGTATSVGTGESIFANLYTLGSPLQSGTQMYIQQGTNTVLPTTWGTGHIDVLLPVQRVGTTINSASVTVFAREWGNVYASYTITLGSGRSPVPMTTAVDTSIVDDESTVSAFTGISLTYGTVSEDLANGNGAKNYDLTIDCGGQSILHVYEYLQYITVRGTTATSLTNGTEGQLYQGLSGYTAIAAAPFGSFAGGKFLAAQGVYVSNLPTADAQNYQLTADDGSTQVPPNVVSVAITSLQSGDRVLIARATSGTSINFGQYALAAGNSLGAATITITTSVASDDPSSGWIRVANTSGTYDLYSYTSRAGSVYSGVSPTLISTYSSGVAAWVPLLDLTASTVSASNTLIFSSAIPVVIRVRNYGGAGASILPFETTGDVTSGGLNVSAIRTSDTIVT